MRDAYVRLRVAVVAMFIVPLISYFGPISGVKAQAFDEPNSAKSDADPRVVPDKTGKAPDTAGSSLFRVREPAGHVPGATGSGQMVGGKRHVTLNFGGYSEYYNYMSYYQGYGGFDWYADIFYMNQSTWTDQNGFGYQAGWCDTGYQNEAAMSDATSLGFIYQYGLMESAKGHSFTFDSMNAAASFSKNAVWAVTSYTEQNGSLYPKATDEFKVSYTGRHLDLAKLGKPGDFKDIAAVAFQMVSYGHPGDICTYGYPVVGAELAIGNVTVTWSKKADLEQTGPLPTPYLLHHQMHAVPRVTAERLAVRDDTSHPSAGRGGGGHGHAPGEVLPPVDHVF